MNRYRRAAAALVAALVLGLPLDGCGDGEDPGAILDQALSSDGLAQITSGTARGGLELSASGPVPGAITLTANGHFDGREADLDLGLTTSGSEGSDLDLEVALTAISENLLVGYRGVTYELGTETFERVRDLVADAVSSPRSFDFDLTAWLEEPSLEGIDRAGGVETNHLSAQIDVERALTDLLALSELAGESIADRAGVRADQLASLAARLFADTKADVFAGVDDGLLRRIDLRLGIDPPGGNEGEPPAELSFSLILRRVNHGKPILPTAEEPRPLEELLQLLPDSTQSTVRCVLDSTTAEAARACGEEAS